MVYSTTRKKDLQYCLDKIHYLARKYNCSLSYGTDDKEKHIRLGVFSRRDVQHLNQWYYDITGQDINLPEEVDESTMEIRVVATHEVPGPIEGILEIKTNQEGVRISLSRRVSVGETICIEFWLFLLN